MHRVAEGADESSASGVLDKHGVLDNLSAAKLDLGCGQRKRGPEYIGIDLLDGPEVDIVGDVFAVLDRVPNGSVARVYSSHFFEHVSDLERLLMSLADALTRGGELEVVVPHFSNPYYYSDPTHRTPFGLYTFSYFIRQTPFKRSTPTYGRDLPFHLLDASLRFKSAPPFYVRHGIRQIFQRGVNASRGIKEFYEENLCYLVPCYEIRFVLLRL